MSRSKAIRIRVAPPLHAEVEQWAEEEGRTISDLIRRLLVASAVQRVTERAQEVA
jgi:hypothetical protein